MKFIDTLNRAQKQAAPARLNQAPNRAPRGPSTGYSGNYDVIPAEWGHTLITLFPPDDDAVDPDTYNVRFNLGYSPIVAWRIDRDGNAPAIAISLTVTRQANSVACRHRTGTCTAPIATALA